MTAWTPEKVAVFREAFLEFARFFPISSKEDGDIMLGDHLYRAQWRFLDAVFEGLSNDIHDFYVLKSRQLGLSTITRGLSLFWLGMHDGLRGGMVFDSSRNTASSRLEIEQALEQLPSHLRFPGIKKGGRNRERLILDNNSWLSFLHAGTKDSKTAGGLGRSQGLNFVHASELCSWVNQEGVTSFRQSLAERYPDRLYIWESTGRGFNIWYNLWQEAKRDPLTRKTIFIGWWAKDNQIIEMDDPRFSLYGQDAPNSRERDRIDEVRELYDWEITQEQLAWYRWRIDPSRELDEDDPEDTNAVQEQPFTESECFQMTGSQFFMSDKLSSAAARINAEIPKPQQFKFWPGDDFIYSDCRRATTYREVELKIWEEPVQDSTYVVAGDPAYGHDEGNDNSAVQIIRCFADGADQVAEYASATIQPHHFAWLLWTLAGYYAMKDNNQVMVIGELNGPGEEVYRQFQSVRKLVQSGYLRQGARELGISNIVKNVTNYLYSRSDSVVPTHNAAWWKTALQNKVQIMEACRNYLHRDVLRVASLDLIEEMRTIRRDGDSIEAEDGNRDDRTFALALAVRAWDERLRPRLIAGNRTREAERAKLSRSIEDQYQMYRNYYLENFFKQKETARRQMQWAQSRVGWRTGVGTHRILPGRRY